MRIASLGGLVTAVAAACTACAPRIAPIAPQTLPPIAPAVVSRWVIALAPRHAARYELHWRYTTQQGSSAGRAVARIEPPDTMRFDYRGPFGRSGAAVVLRDSALWVRPASDANGTIPAAPLFWLALGAPQIPPADAQLFGVDDGKRHTWRTVRGNETMDIVVESAPGRLQAQWRRNGELVGTCDVHLDANRLPTDAVLTFPPQASRFTLVVDSVDTLATHDPAIWSAPH